MDQPHVDKSIRVRYEFCGSDPDKERLYQMLQLLLPLSEIVEIINHELEQQSRVRVMESN